MSGDFFQTHGPVLRYRATAMRNPEDIPLLFPDPVIEAYLKDVDRTILRANLQLSTAERFEQFEKFARAVQRTRARAIERDRQDAA